MSAANHDLILLLNKPYDYWGDGYKKISFFKEGAGIFLCAPILERGHSYSGALLMSLFKNDYKINTLAFLIVNIQL